METLKEQKVKGNFLRYQNQNLLYLQEPIKYLTQFLMFKYHYSCNILDDLKYCWL